MEPASALAAVVSVIVVAMGAAIDAFVFAVTVEASADASYADFA